MSSVCRQTYDEWELIVSDDGSSDSTCEKVLKIAENDERIRLVASDLNRGVAHARNLAAKNANGEYLAFLDSDDRWLPTKIEKQLHVMEHLGSDWGASYTGARVHLINRKKTIESRPTKSGDLFQDMLRFRAPIWTPTFMVRSKVYHEVGGMDESLLRHQDLDFYRKVAERYKIEVLSEPLTEIYLFTNKEFGIEHIHAKEIMFKRYWEKTLDAHGAWVASRVWGREWLVASGCMFRSGDKENAMKYLFRALKTNPIQNIDDYARLLLNVLRSMKSLPGVNDAGTVE